MNHAEQGKLSGRVAIVTGASKGIGRASALLLAKTGAKIVAVARSQDKLMQLKSEIEELGSSCGIVNGDVAQEDVAKEATRLAQETFGQLDILVNNAGIGSYASLLEYDVSDYDMLMNTNMRSTFLFTRYAVPIMKQQSRGLILQISSQAGLRGFANEAIYCATKHAQVGFTNALRLELQPFGIKVGVICPAGVKTEFALGKGRTEEGVATSGFLDAEDVAEAVLFAATQSPNARMTQIGLVALEESL
jgi:NADP-dependent 3-hydroxy acid dehydrogenase YdfG